MIIKEQDFELRYDAEHDRFDCYTVKVINAKDPEKRREELSILGSSHHFDGILERLIQNRIKRKKETQSIRVLLNDYKKQVQEFREILKEIKTWSS